MQVTPYPFQLDAINRLNNGIRLIIAPPGSGKTLMFFQWLEQQNAHKIVIVTTASKAKSGDFLREMVKFTSPKFQSDIDKLEVVSWHMLKKWTTDKTPRELSDWVFVADECQRCKQGVSSMMGRAFLFLTKNCRAWAGFTGTPGDKWIDLYPYLQAAGYIKNKTQFMRDFCIMNPYTPFPKIDRYKDAQTLKKWWREIAYAPDAATIMSQLPPQNHERINFPAPKNYKKVLKTCHTLEGDLLESDMALFHYLRMLTNTKDKTEWLGDLLDSLPDDPVVIFYNYTCERESILEVAKKAKRKVWRIDGECHEIPTEETISKNDIILCHYLSGSEALNLQFCNRWVSWSWNYSYSTTKQSIGRIRRIGQVRPQFYYWLTEDGTVDDDIRKALKNKQDFAKDEWRPKRS